jgi:hypothetical protein
VLNKLDLLILELFSSPVVLRWRPGIERNSTIVLSTHETIVQVMGVFIVAEEHYAAVLLLQHSDELYIDKHAKQLIHDRD